MRSQTVRKISGDDVRRAGGCIVSDLTRALGIACVCLVLAIAIMSAARRPSEPAIDLSKIGPQVGQRVPDFSLTDQNGRVETLQSIMGPNGAMIVFFRSADW
jgi:hypothetical protein